MIKIIDRYIFNEFSRVFMFVLFAACAVIIIVDGFEQADYFIDRKAGIILVLKYYFYWLPHHIILILPIAVLLSTLMTVGRLSRNSELIAMKACGISLWRIFVPLFFLGVFIALFALFLGEMVTITNYRLAQVKRIEIEKKQPLNYLSQSQIHYFGSKGHLYYIDFFDGAHNRLRRVVVYEFNQNSHLKRRIDAEFADYQSNQWIFHQGIERIFVNSDSLIANKFENLSMPELEETPNDFGRRQKKPDEMNFQELKDYITRVKRSGGEIGKDEVDLYLKIAFPCANLIILIFGAPLSISGRRNSPAISVIVSVSLAFIYWIFIQLGRALGHNGDLTPLIAAWLPNTVFFIFGLAALIRAPK